MHEVGERNARQFLRFPARLHHTIATGDVISKQHAGRYALEVFDGEWHPIIEEALAYWEGEPAHPAFADKKARHTRSGEFALHVIDSANALATAISMRPIRRPGRTGGTPGRS